MAKIISAFLLYFRLPTAVRELAARCRALQADIDDLRIELGKLEAEFDLTDLRADTIARSYQALEDRVGRAEYFVRRPLDEFTAMLAKNDRDWRVVLRKLEGEYNKLSIRRNERKFPPRNGRYLDG